jgi:antitoxin component of RelBE/YafQ-DinJ toxin-antitoxin module
MKRSTAFSVDSKIYEEFKNVTMKEGLVMSFLIENFMKEVIKERTKNDK